MQPVTAKHIVSDPEKCGGKPCIFGTRIRVWDIYVASELRGESPDQIVAQYPTLSLADVHAALAYYWDNREMINQQMKEADEFVASMQAATGPGPIAKLLANQDIASQNTGSDSISP